MVKKLMYSLAFVRLCVPVLQARKAGEAPFATLEKAVKQEPGGLPAVL